MTESIRKRLLAELKAELQDVDDPGYAVCLCVEYMDKIFLLDEAEEVNNENK